jgi:hypothetical protein
VRVKNSERGDLPANHTSLNLKGHKTCGFMLLKKPNQLIEDYQLIHINKSAGLIRVMPHEIYALQI